MAFVIVGQVSVACYGVRFGHAVSGKKRVMSSVHN